RSFTSALYGAGHFAINQSMLAVPLDVGYPDPVSARARNNGSFRTSLRRAPLSILCAWAESGWIASLRRALSYNLREIPPRAHRRVRRCPAANGRIIPPIPAVVATN